MSLLLCALLAASDPWILVRDENHVSMSGSLTNLATAQKYLKKFGGGYLWFRHGGKEFVVRDGKTLQEAETAIAGEEPNSAEEAIVDAQEQEIDRHQQKIDRHQQELEEYEDVAGDDPGMQRARRALEKAQAELNRAQEKLGKAQERLGRESERLSKEMDKKMEQLIQRALQQGLAQEMPR